jgi:pimeloyl-ACP methyl ester carboxylesterase
MIETFIAPLPDGASLSCRAAGRRDAPLLLFLHGFPEGAFIWDEMMEALSTRFRCVAPNLRGYERSHSPMEVEAYRARHLVDDIAALAQHLDAPVEALVAHDWGGVVGWALGAQAPTWLRRLVIINSPHPATFLRELQRNPAQQAASMYMNFLRRPEAEAMLVDKDYERMWQFFTGMGALEGPQPGAGWLTNAVKAQYREVWSHGLTGALNYYRASPLHPPTGADDPVVDLQLPPELTHVKLPTLVLWAEGDVALLPALLDGLEEYVPQLRVVRIEQATHWVIHEQPMRLAAAIDEFLQPPA